MPDSDGMLWLKRASGLWMLYVTIFSALAGWGILGGMEGFAAGLSITLGGRFFLWLAMDTQRNLDRMANEDEPDSRQVP